MEELIAIAKLVKVRGIRGEFVCNLLTDFPERFEDLETVIAVLPSGKREELRIENFFFQKNRIVLKFENFDTIEVSERLINAEICVPETDAVELEEGEFFDWELQGCKIETLDGEILGTVLEVMRTGGTENLVVEGKSKNYLIPFAEAICPEVDIENKLIRVDLPDGLLDF